MLIFDIMTENSTEKAVQSSGVLESATNQDPQDNSVSYGIVTGNSDKEPEKIPLGPPIIYNLTTAKDQRILAQIRNSVASTDRSRFSVDDTRHIEELLKARAKSALALHPLTPETDMFAEDRVSWS